MAAASRLRHAVAADLARLPGEVRAEIIDPQNATLTVLRWAAEGYVVALTAGRTDRVRAEPFVEVELPVGALFGDEVDEP